jgi:ABC-type multidrug transport system fused ATPase/permease subunit
MLKLSKGPKKHHFGRSKSWSSSKEFEDIYTPVSNTLETPHYNMVNWHHRIVSKDISQIFIDNYLFTIPLLIGFILVHFYLASVLITKFKCQQHFYLYYWVLSLGPVYLSYIYLYWNHGGRMLTINLVGKIAPYSSFKYPLFEHSGVEWPIYIGLYQWWVFLIYYMILTIIFFYFAPTTIYLRSKNVFTPKSANNYFIICLIILSMPPLFFQDRLPVCQWIYKFLFTSLDDTLSYYGIVYILVIFLLLAISSVLMFYLIIISSNLINYFINNKNEKYLRQITYLLFSKIEDNRDWDANESLPAVLVTKELKDDSNNKEDISEPDGTFWYFPNPKNYYFMKQGWKRSMSRNIFFAWLICNFLFSWLTYFLFTNYGLSIALIIVYTLFCFFISLTVFLILNFNLSPELFTIRKHYIYSYLVICIHFIFLIIFGEDIISAIHYWKWW